MIITNRPPAFTGEADALTVSVSVLDGGAAYTPVGNVLAKLYLYWPGTINMSEAVDLTITGSTLTGSLPDTLTAVPGCPLMVIQLTDTDSGDLIVAAATPIQITSVLGERVISSRPATPSEIIYIGRSPYIDVATGHWMQWDTASSGYIDTGVSAAGRPASFSATATSLPAGSAPTASITGTPDAPVLNLGIPKGDTGATGQRGPTGAAAGFGTPTASVDANVGTPSVSVSASGPNTAKVFNFAFHNLKGQKGDTGGVSSVNGKTGVVQLNDEDIPSSAVAGATTVEEALSKQSQQIDDLADEVDNLQAAAAFVEDGDTASRTYTEGQFILWKGLLYTVKAGGMPQGETLSTTTYLDDVTGGGLNKLYSNIGNISLFHMLTVTVTTSALGNANLPQISQDSVIVGTKAERNYAVDYIGRGSNGVYYAHIVQSNGDVVTNTELTIDIYYVNP